MDFQGCTDFWRCGLRGKSKPCGELGSGGRGGNEEGYSSQKMLNCHPSGLASLLSSPRATRHQTSWQGQPTPAEMSQCRGGNTGHADFLFNLLFIQGKSAECAATGPHNHSPPLRCSRWGLPASIVPISELCKKREHYSFFPAPDFQKSQARWIRAGVRPATNHTGRLNLVPIKYIKRCYL